MNASEKFQIITNIQWFLTLNQNWNKRINWYSIFKKSKPATIKLYLIRHLCFQHRHSGVNLYPEHFDVDSQFHEKLAINNVQDIARLNIS